jgi:thiosulfate/3-mercaptopyruvate sulfurtransferase
MPVPLLVSTEWLAQYINNPDLRIVDVRWYLFDKDKTGYSEYLRGHVPGAVFMDLDRDLASPPGLGPGRHPLPKADVFAQAAARAGIAADKHVIAYDDRGAASAARLWWLLRYFGHDRVSLLDGGISKWVEEKRPLQTEIPTVPESHFVPHPRPEMVVDANMVDRLHNDPRALVLDVRVAERYEGKIEPIDPRAGHVPGAKNAPYPGNLQPDQRFLSAEELRRRFEALGAGDKDKIVSYCGSGVNACQNIFALHLAGLTNALLYEGSWSDWSSTPSRPLAIGTKP